MAEAVAGFNWDEGNREKCRKHGVTIEEIEREIQKKRFIRPISARFMHAKEIKHYEAQNQNPGKIA
jgi:uncharacterized DUF497 family protein